MARRTERKEKFDALMDFCRELQAELSPAANIEEAMLRPRTDNSKYQINIIESEPVNISFLDYQPDNAPFANLKLRYFMDGIQRTQIVGHFTYNDGPVPIHFGLNAVAVLQRNDRHFKMWTDPIQDEYLILPYKLLNDHCLSLVDKYQKSGIKIIDSKPKSIDYPVMRMAAIMAVYDQRQNLEETILEQWNNSNPPKDSVMVVDGSTLTFKSELFKGAVIGYCKGMNFNYDDVFMRDIKYRSLKECHRSQIFKISSSLNDIEPRYSFFIKLRFDQRFGPEFGIARPEFSISDPNQVSQLADQITYLVVKERMPVIMGDTKWDNLIYPIRHTTNYLSSIIPSINTIQAYFSGGS